MIRVVPTGDLGLDVLLGGGWRLVKRFEDRESATVVVRGGSGAGKTLLGIQVALELAQALGGDVAVGCVEILPTEYVAQLHSARPSLAPERVARLPASPSAAAGEGPRVYVSLLSDLSPDKPDLVTALEGLDASVKAAGGNPVAFVVDSLIEGYGLGANTPRIDADDVLKFAARYGRALVLCEEVTSDAASPWVFAADTVLELGVEPRERGRWIEVRKHRFGPSATGRHELILGAKRGPVAIPLVSAWVPHASYIQRAIGLDTERDDVAFPDLRWPTSPPITGALISIASKAPYLSERLAMTLEPKRKQALAFELDPIATGPVAWRNPTRGRGASIPTASGVDRAFRWMVEEVASAVDGDGELLIDRVVVGDLQTVTSSDSLYSWLAALRALAQLLSPYSAPVIMCTRLPGDAQTADRLQEQLSSCAESAVRLDVPGEGPNVTSVGAVISDMLTRVFDVVELPLPRDADRAR